MLALAGPLREVEVIATGPSVRDRARLRKVYGHGRWRKLKGGLRFDWAMVA